MTSQELTAFYLKWSKTLYNSALRILKEPMEAEDTMQETIIKFITATEANSKHDVRPMSDAQANVWLRKTCIRSAIDRLRFRKRRKLFAERYAREEEEPKECDFSGLSSFEPSRDIGIIKEKVSELPDKYRVVLSLFLFEGYDYEEIASITGQKNVTVRSQYMRGKKMLAGMLVGKFGKR
ncbi:MAG: sigma-70 family RNA polymerase sigma factor [Bacteroidales bacterium]|jgi:RNA polymerase sigma-70 factor (ECF subfamily)|nr:sigma-70 family RNA polymerase sigma factor [Bacteroidales bacterium]MCI2122066.1 sigma-70 family RNA polymerase sigma factor [Bacteroidales bacterium]MCI2146193.1 sigma-70 family RNA polymerase sigma factor [Bacteroidales bacterium]